MPDLKFLIAATAFVCSLPQAAIAYAVYNPITDFSFKNPNGPWSYESYASYMSSPKLMVDYTDIDIGGGDQFRLLYDDGLTSINYATRTYDFTIVSGLATATSNSLVLVPGYSGEWVGAVFTAPAAANYVFFGAFDNRDSTPIGTGTSAGVYTGSVGAPVSLDSGPMTGADALRTIDFTRALTAGERVGFWARPTSGSLGLQAIGLTLTVTDPRRGDDVVPEPSSWAMMIAGFGLVGAATRRKRATRATNALIA